MFGITLLMECSRHATEEVNEYVKLVREAQRKLEEAQVLFETRPSRANLQKGHYRVTDI